MSDQQVITVWAENFVCERESTELSSSDEIYFDFYAYTSSGAHATLLSQVFTSVDAGETHGFTNATIWQQIVPADGLTVILLTWEEDGGTSEAARRQRLQNIVASQHGGSAEGLTAAQWRSLPTGYDFSSGSVGIVREADDVIGGYVFRIPATGLGTGQVPSTFEAVIDGSGRGESRVRLRLRARQGGAGRLVRLINVHSGKALTVHGATTDDGANVDQWTYHPGQANQHWSLEDTGNGYKLTNANSAKVLDVANLSQFDGANVHQWNDTGAANQRWDLEDTGNGHKLTSVHSGKVLSVTGWSTDDGGNVLQWADESGAHQRWHIQDV